ncbi:FMN-binding negative transcriptional regulator [Kribbella sp. GL6]|uniref:FMN-binding negative transcriptional regulator n=1 Tax=Kribbella sp. GL6 TaxID=3419765 RepID=UPI003CFC4355
MLHHAEFELSDVAVLRELIRSHGWVTMVSAVAGEPVISHLPVVLEAERDGISVVGHLGRPDDRQHRLGEIDTTLIVYGPHGYVSPTWYGVGGYVPTWNYVVAHLSGRPEVLGAEETFEVLRRTCDHFETGRPVPWRLEGEEAYARRIAPATAGFRLVPDRIVAKAKLSQDKPAEVVARVIDALADDPVHANPQLAAAMRAVS